MKMYDIAIIGLGPAGATVSRLLSKKYKILALDRKNNNISKCCGGLLSPDAQKILAPIYTSIFDKEFGKSYSWTISKNQYFIVGGAFPEETCNENFEELKLKLRKKGYKFSKDKLVKREGCFVYLSNAFNSVHIGKDNVYLIGEAAGMISPSSLEGISYAMDSGHILAEVLNKQLLNSNHKFLVKTLKLRTKLKLKILKRPFMYNKLLRKLVMKSGLQSIKKSIKIK